MILTVKTEKVNKNIEIIVDNLIIMENWFERFLIYKLLYKMSRILIILYIGCIVFFVFVLQSLIKS